MDGFTWMQMFFCVKCTCLVLGPLFTTSLSVRSFVFSFVKSQYKFSGVALRNAKHSMIPKQALNYTAFFYTFSKQTLYLTNSLERQFRFLSHLNSQKWRRSFFILHLWCVQNEENNDKCLKRSKWTTVTIFRQNLFSDVSQAQR